MFSAADKMYLLMSVQFTNARSYPYEQWKVDSYCFWNALRLLKAFLSPFQNFCRILGQISVREALCEWHENQT